MKRSGREKEREKNDEGGWRKGGRGEGWRKWGRAEGGVEEVGKGRGRGVEEVGKGRGRGVEEVGRGEGGGWRKWGRGEEEAWRKWEGEREGDGGVGKGRGRAEGEGWRKWGRESGKYKEEEKTEWSEKEKQRGKCTFSTQGGKKATDLMKYTFIKILQCTTNGIHTFSSCPGFLSG